MPIVMIIDDDVDMVDMYQAVLNQKGHEVIIAYTAEEARKTLATKRPDIVVLDVMMETVDAGFELGREIHTKFPDLPILFLSSIISEIDEKTGIPNIFEVDDSWLKLIRFLDKPVKAEKLSAEIDKLLA